MELVTLNWQEIKDNMRNDLLGVKQSFVRIGYFLRQIEDNKLYENDGYKSITEFAEKEYGLSATIVSRFKAINATYSIDGYSDALRPEYVDFKRSQLEEMLTLSDADRQMIQPEASRASIRELKQFNNQETVSDEIDDVHQLITEFFRIHKSELNQIYVENADVNEIKEIVNPSGNKSFRKGMYFMMMYDSKIQIKKFGQSPKEFTWNEFYEVIKDIFGEGSGTATWKNYFGIEEQDHSEPINGEENNSLSEEQLTKTELKENEIAEELVINNMQEKEIIEEESSNKIEKTEDESTMKTVYLPVEALDETVEIIKKPFGTRKEYLDSLTLQEEAEYMCKEFKENRLAIWMFDEPSDYEEWLSKDVDSFGGLIDAILD